MSDDNFRFSDEDRSFILRSAIQVAGPGASAAEVGAEAARIAHLLSPASLVSSSVTDFERSLEDVITWKKVYTGVLVHVNKEIRSNRGIIVTLHAPSDSNGGTGFELVRSPMLTNENARSMMRSAASRLGERVTMKVAQERMQNRNSVNVLHDLLFRGQDREYQPIDPTQIPWHILGGAGKPYDTSRLQQNPFAQMVPTPA